MSSVDEIIRVVDLSKTIKNGANSFTILEHMSFSVPRSALFAINGPSGSGKSTLLNMLTGIDRPSQGQIFVADQELSARGEDQLARWRGIHVGIIFQFFQLIPTLTSLENILLALELGNTHRYPRNQWRKRAMECLEQVDLADLADRLPSQLSGGQQQRVAIARAIVNDPPILIADEPTGSLDSKTAFAVFDVLKQLTIIGKTVVYVTHDTQLSQLASHRIHILDGRIVTHDEFHQYNLAESRVDQ